MIYSAIRLGDKKRNTELRVRGGTMAPPPIKCIRTNSKVMIPSEILLGLESQEAPKKEVLLEHLKLFPKGL